MLLNMIYKLSLEQQNSITGTISSFYQNCLEEEEKIEKLLQVFKVKFMF